MKKGTSAHAQDTMERAKEELGSVPSEGKLPSGPNISSGSKRVLQEPNQTGRDANKPVYRSDNSRSASQPRIAQDLPKDARFYREELGKFVLAAGAVVILWPINPHVAQGTALGYIMGVLAHV